MGWITGGSIPIAVGEYAREFLGATYPTVTSLHHTHIGGYVSCQWGPSMAQPTYVSVGKILRYGKVVAAATPAIQSGPFQRARVGAAGLGCCKEICPLQVD